MRRVELISLAGAAAGIMLSFFAVVSVSAPQGLRTRPTPSPLLLADRIALVSDHVDRARAACLAWLPVDPAGLDNPFCDPAALKAPAVVYPGSASSASRPLLVLRGQLIKDRPLAILEDENGTTIILGVGDSIALCRVTAITAASVTLKDRFGSFIISAAP